MSTKIVIGVVLVLAIGGVWFATSEYSANLFGRNTDGGIVYKNADKDMIVVENIPAGVTVLPEFKAFGQARGTWYFEASFPVEVVAADGRRLAMVPAQAQGEWMTEEFVPFIAAVQITEDYSGPATLILHKDNPSGEASRDASVEIPIVIQ